jgi:hypothetical protein
LVRGSVLLSFANEKSAYEIFPFREFLFAYSSLIIPNCSSHRPGSDSETRAGGT